MEILLIDDDQDDVEIFIDALDQVGENFMICSSVDSISALHQLSFSNKLPDVIFLDINMPRMDGYEFIKEVKNIERLKDLDIILISNPPEELVIPKISHYQKVRYLAKPASYDSLKNSLSRLLDQS
ncbi:response regulator [Flavobacterium endoglycinae]|uniref:Response regulator n=1 Tax=Flavobacterium endoglycinae TaxID=2816357 RepID=A0ABX7QCS2_9FLAO|nr:response regulator [Flavobacterium endoglycinae]QSW88438.1 response regulator [Flavobacterium endoglycinae]